MGQTHYGPTPSQATTNRQQGNRQTGAMTAHEAQADTTPKEEPGISVHIWQLSEHNPSEPGDHPKPEEDSEEETIRVKSELQTLEKHRCQHDPCGAHFRTAEELGRHQAQGHPNVPVTEHLVCWWPRCGKDYVSAYYLKQHCEFKCRYRNNQDNHRLPKPEQSVPTVTPAHERPAKETPSKVTKVPVSSQQPKRKASAAKASKGAKKPQKMSERSPSPPPSPSPPERPSSPEEDEFVTSRRPSAASVFPSQDEVGPKNPSLTYLGNLGQSSSWNDDPVPAAPKAHGQIPATTGKLALEDHSLSQDQVNSSFPPPGPRIPPAHPQQASSQPGLAPQSMYHYNTQVTTYGIPNPHPLPPFLHDPAMPTQEGRSGAPTLSGPVAFHLDPSHGQGHIPQVPNQSPSDQFQPATTNQYHAPGPVQPEQPPQPIFERIEPTTGARMRIAESQGPRHGPYGNNGFAQNCQVFDVWTPEQPISDDGSNWSHPPSAPYGDATYYPGHFTG